MRLLEFGRGQGFREERFDSVAFDVTPVARSVSSLSCLYLGPGGVIGRHDAVGAQLFCVVAGSGTVAGDDRAVRPIAAGQAALWEAGESHETRSETGLTAVVAEGRDITVLLGRDRPVTS
jgi:mannose-6-phosphate isomerase-like protein (cupin superfamily)